MNLYWVKDGLGFLRFYWCSEGCRCWTIVYRVHLMIEKMAKHMHGGGGCRVLVFCCEGAPFREWEN
ncbi:hypothetical protein Scep_017175 [Stephania cephalantha]|uniref:Uncharacterized protein n=1 Tax=Stephania cephalantha TaxID=152367 RepID=A0AAP0IP53_9MAGN